MGRPECFGTVNVSNTLVPQLGEMGRCHLGALRIVRTDAARRNVQFQRRNANIIALFFAQDFGKSLIFGDRWRQDDAVRLVLQDEGSYPFTIIVFATITWTQNELKSRVAQRIQDAALHIDDILRAWVVIDEPDQERLAEGEGTRLRVRREPSLRDDFLHFFAGLFTYKRRLVDHA